MDKDVLLVLGASSDIGVEIIRNVYSENTVIIAQYNSSKDKIGILQNQLGKNIIPIKADFLIEEDALDLISFVSNNYSHPTKIVHLSAPKMSYIRFKDIHWNHFKNYFDIQIKSIVMILNKFLPIMARLKYGKVVFMISSCTFNIPPKALAHYVTVKYALLGLMKALASEYADKNIQINAVSPSMVETSFLSEIPDKIVEMEAEQNPLKRNATPMDIAPIVKFLLSDDSAFITGTNIPISGGKNF
ncbi:MAG: SDR family oxidoreductase [Nitrospirae bacterium]|nr:SDR family oxidoreductase [Nitrospirota bacterium]